MDPSAIIGMIALAALLTPIAVVDARRFVIPNGLNAALFAAGLAFTGTVESRSVLVAALGAGVTVAAVTFVSMAYRYGRGVRGLGAGDVKFLGAAAAWLKLEQMPWLVLIACCSALTAVLFNHFHSKSIARGDRIAFGPHLCAGLFLTFALQPGLMPKGFT